MQATDDQIADKVNLVLRGYPTQGVELPLLITITKVLLHDDGLKAARVEVEAVIERMEVVKRRQKGVERYFQPATVAPRIV